jgi:hypothetical protein
METFSLRNLRRSRVDVKARHVVVAYRVGFTLDGSVEDRRIGNARHRVFIVNLAKDVGSSRSLPTEHLPFGSVSNEPMR